MLLANEGASWLLVALCIATTESAVPPRTESVSVAGVWFDVASLVHGSLAGARFIAETSQLVRLVGTDDGETWFSLTGTREGPADIIFSSHTGSVVTGARLSQEADGTRIMLLHSTNRTMSFGAKWRMATEPTEAWTHRQLLII